MPKFAAEMEQIFDSVFAGSAIDPKTGKLVVADQRAFQRADEALKTVLEKMAKEKWLVKESAGDSLAHMAGLIKFEELNAGPSSLKTTPKAPVKAGAAPVAESTKGGLNFTKAFETLREFDENPADEAGLDGGDEVTDGADSFENAQIGAGDQAAASGADQDLTDSGADAPDELGGTDSIDGMGDQGQQDMGGDIGDGSEAGDNPLDFDLSDLDSFDDLAPAADGVGAQAGAQAGTPNDEELVTGGQPGGAFA